MGEGREASPFIVFFSSIFPEAFSQEKNLGPLKQVLVHMEKSFVILWFEGLWYFIFLFLCPLERKHKKPKNGSWDDSGRVRVSKL